MLLCLILGICLGLINAQQQQIYTNQNTGDEDLYFPHIQFSDTFDWKLLKEFATRYKNVLISPITLKLTLALLYQGSAGLAEKEFQNVLEFTDKETVNHKYSQILSSLQDSERREYLLNMGTGVFLNSQISVDPTFEVKLNRYYRTEVRPVNFTSPTVTSYIINSWVNQITNGKISEIVNAGDLHQTVMLLASAVYFKNTWRHQFPKNQTYFGNFFVGQQQSVTVPFMSTTDSFFMKDSLELDSKILRLPYKESNYSFFIILPNDITGLPELIKRINLRNIPTLVHSLEKRVVEVHIPKFKFNFKTKMAEALRNFGLHQIFENGASFAGIFKNGSDLSQRLVVSDIIQKNGIELDEEGSVIYSATGVDIGNKFGNPTEVFHATHPFVFFVEGPNRTILFIGKIENPLEKESIEKTESFSQIDKVLGAADVFSTPKPFSNIHDTIITRSEPSFSDVQPSKSNQPPNLESANSDLDAVDLEELQYRFNLFDMELLSVFGETKTNVFLSPASIKTTLAMVLEGARGNCAIEINEALRIPNINEKGVRAVLIRLLNTLQEKSQQTYLENSNAVFVSNKQKVVDKYQQVINQFYRGTVKTINFIDVGQSVNLINNWVSQATHGSINEIVGPQNISPDTSAVIINALYFKGKWKTAFDSQATKTECFHTEDGCIPTPMMRSSAYFNYNYISQLRAHAVEIPYQNNFSMLILLPSQETNIRSVVRDLPHYKLKDILSKLKSTDITLEIPKFAFDHSVDLVEHLKLLKIREIFGPRANLSGIVENGNVIVNSLVHKTRIEVDEQGTVAAAATGAIVVTLMGPTTLTVDRPFIFYICHQDTIIFEGILMNPKENINSEIPPPDKTQSKNFNTKKSR